MAEKTSRQLERHLKGLANHWRLDILFLLAKNDDLTLEGIIERLKGNQKTLSFHTTQLVHAGLLRKEYRGRTVVHTLSPYGKKFYHFLKTLQQS